MLFRLATEKDYKQIAHNLYQLSFDNELAPGNPTDTPSIGWKIYNEYKLELLKKKNINDHKAVVTDIINVCLNSEPYEFKSIAEAILFKKYNYNCPYCIALSLLEDEIVNIDNDLKLRLRLKLSGIKQ